MCKMSSDSDSSEDENAAQMRQFMEAADHTLLTNAMYQTKPESSPTHVSPPISTPAAPPAKSERYLDEQNTSGLAASDLQISEQMQTHVWRKLSALIEDQIEFCDQPSEQVRKPTHVSRVRLVSNADCYLSAEILDVGPAGPQKKPTIKRRQLPEEQPSTAADLTALAISGASLLAGEDMRSWAKKPKRKDKLFEYAAKGEQLKAIEPSNEFTAQRRKNSWNESKIKKAKNKTKP